jgi:hypothetical protein
MLSSLMLCCQNELKSLYSSDKNSHLESYTPSSIFLEMLDDGNPCLSWLFCFEKEENFALSPERVTMIERKIDKWASKVERRPKRAHLGLA